MTDPGRRRQLATALRRTIADAEKPASNALGSRVPVNRAAVWTWREALLGIAQHFECPRTVNPAGAARLLLLLGEATSPLYSAGAERELGEAIWWIADGLQPCLPHDWDCPVLMKLDPEHVAWTCRRCGAIALTEDRAIKPA